MARLSPRALELLARLQERVGAPSRPWMADTFPEQRAFIEESSKRCVALCSRRAGKSEGLARWFLDGMVERPNSLSVYIVQKGRGYAREILGTALDRLNQHYALGLRVRELDGRLHYVHPNGSRVWLTGCKDSTEAEKLRGLAYYRAAIDEAQTFGDYIRYLVHDALEPALIDQDGSLALTGTPGVTPIGMLYEASTGDGSPQWPTHHWTLRDNPYLPNVDAWLADKMAREGWDETHPTYLREYCGQWVHDTGALVYPYSGPRNACRELPEGNWVYGMGIDLGYEDSTAFVVACYRRGHPELYFIRAEKLQHLIPSAIAAHVERYRREYKLTTIVADAGALGKGYVEELRQTYGIPVRAAEKQNKRAFIELLAGDLRSGLVKADPYAARSLVEEWQVLPWSEDRTEPDARYEDHASDAALYLARALRPFYRPEYEQSEPGTEAWLSAEEAREKAERKERVRKRLRGDPFAGLR